MPKPIATNMDVTAEIVQHEGDGSMGIRVRLAVDGKELTFVVAHPQTFDNLANKFGQLSEILRKEIKDHLSRQ